MIKKTLIAAGICLLAAKPLLAEIDVFQWIDNQGRRHYSDRSKSDAKVLKLAPGATYYVVEKVFDGDTLLLSDGQKVRLLGINTPEVAGRYKNAEAGGAQAKDWLHQQLAGRKVRLEGDVEKQDKYQRSLAYVFTEDKRHMNLELVKQGLAAVNIYPPNLKYVAVLLDAQQAAESAGLGIWGRPEYAPQSFEILDDENYRGWKRITGTVRALKKTSKYSYLQFSDRVSVRIENGEGLSSFPDLQSYVGKFIEARGWVNKHAGRFVVQIRHPGELKVSRR
ncbi:MAG: nuclease [Methylomonas sp.]|jgi:endonuclease YncB( thermonuclease family)|nr:MAG: nuclease [Methylomonas sp.]